MPSTLLIFRLHPETPVSGEEFTNYLKGLSIAAHALSFGDPEGKGSAFATGTYLPPTSLPVAKPPVPNLETRITQHFEIIEGEITNFFAVATAVIEIPFDIGWNREHGSIDVRLVITRDGKQIVDQQNYYNLPVAPIATATTLKKPNDFPKLQPVGLHLALPAPGQKLATIAAAPADVAPPNFVDLRAAMEKVLAVEAPGSDVGFNDLPIRPGPIGNLTREQCRHIAREIVSDPTTVLAACAEPFVGSDVHALSGCGQ